MKLSEQTKIESQIGFTAGIMVGALASWVYIMFFTSWEWYFKLFSTIGEIGILGSLWFQIKSSLDQRRAYLEMKKMMNDSTNKENDIPLGVDK